MKLTIVAVGRLKSGPERDLFQRYAERFGAEGRRIGLSGVKLIEIRESRAQQSAARKTDEAQDILGRCGARARLLALDESGEEQSSRQFASTIATSRDAGTAEMCFAIGGPDGHGEALLEAACARLSLGRMTLPHGLARVVLAEQLYRAATILAGHPYHRD